MSVAVLTWVWKHSNAEGIDRLVLLALADCANDDGREAYPSLAHLSRKAKVHKRTVQRAVERLVDMGEVVIVSHGGPGKPNRYRITMNPGTPPPGMAAPRPDGTPPTRQGAYTAERHVGTESPAYGHTATTDVGTVPTEPSVEPSENRQEEPFMSEPASRPDVEAICLHLADRIEANGSKRPKITKKWRDAARLMLDRDDRTAEQVIRAIDWCQDHEFWRSNVLSMPKLRDKYDQLRLAAQRSRASPTRSTTDEKVAATVALAAELDKRGIIQ